MAIVIALSTNVFATEELRCFVCSEYGYSFGYSINNKTNIYWATKHINNVHTVFLPVLILI